jgi:hypothetical protein
MNAILIVCLVSLVTAAAMAALVRRFRANRRPGLHIDPAGISARRYGPMERLLDPADEAFVAAHSGSLRRFRAERRRIFQCYLRSLERDFASVCGAIRLILVHSGQDRPELASALMRREIRFALAVFAVRCRLLLYVAGIGHVDVRGVLGALDDVRAELGNLVPVAAGVAA